MYYVLGYFRKCLEPVGDPSAPVVVVDADFVVVQLVVVIFEVVGDVVVVDEVVEIVVLEVEEVVEIVVVEVDEDE